MLIAINLLRENLRNKVLYLLTGLGLLALFLVLLAGTVEERGPGGGQAVKLSESLLGKAQVGFTIMGFFSAIVAVLVSMNSIPREFERRTIHLLLIRPVPRWRVALELLLGNILAAFGVHLVLACGVAVVLLIKGASISLLISLIPAVLATGINVAFITCATTLFSARLPGVVAACGGLGIYIAGTLRGLFDMILQTKILGALEAGMTSAQSSGAITRPSSWAIGASFWENLRLFISWVIPPINEVASEGWKFLAKGAFIDAKVFLAAAFWLYFGVLLVSVSLYGKEV